jgi:predicted nucleic acid-binding Zn ribbon protein
MINKKGDYSHSLKEVLDQLVKAYRWGGKISEMRIKDSWRKVVGQMIDRHTESMQVKGKILYVSLDSSALRSELMMARSKIVDSLNKELGAKVLDDIVFR